VLAVERVELSIFQRELALKMPEPPTFVPPTHPEAQHFVLHQRAKPHGASHVEADAGASGQAQDAALDYMQAMAGFMGVVEAPKEVDALTLADAATAFLHTLWETDHGDVCPTCAV
jgi:hypothetical protein